MIFRFDPTTLSLSKIGSLPETISMESLSILPSTSPNELDGTMGLIAAQILAMVRCCLLYSHLPFITQSVPDDTPGNSEMTRKWMKLGFIAQEHYGPKLNLLPIYIEKERHPNFPHTDMIGKSR